MSKTSTIVLSASAIICASILAYTALKAIDNIYQVQRTVAVKGLAEREVKADTAIWPLPIVRAGNDPTALYKSLDADIQATREFLLERGFAATEMTVSAPAVLDKAAERYGNFDERKDLRYSGQQTLTVYTSNVDLVREVRQQLSVLGQQGVHLGGNSYEHQVEYHFNGLNSIKPSMVDESAQNARAVALRFAEHSNSQLGAIAQAQQGQFSISDRDSNNAHLKIVRVVSTVRYQLVD